MSLSYYNGVLDEPYYEEMDWFPSEISEQTLEVFNPRCT